MPDLGANFIARRPSSRIIARAIASCHWPDDELAEDQELDGHEFELLGEREPGKAAFALLAEPGTGKYLGTGFITLGRDMKDRLLKRVRGHAGPPPEAMKKRPATRADGSLHDPNLERCAPTDQCAGPCSSLDPEKRGGCLRRVDGDHDTLQIGLAGNVNFFAWPEGASADSPARRTRSPHPGLERGSLERSRIIGVTGPTKRCQ